jgi:hypothetical protein
VNIRRSFLLTLCVALWALALAVTFLLVCDPARAQSSTRYVATTGSDSGDCTDSANPCRTVQYAVDAANDEDIIKVATGVYTDMHLRNGITQTVYISKTVTIRGGYSAPGFFEPPDPETNPTTLDAQRQGRVLAISGNITATIEGLRITGGDAAGLGGGIPLGSDAGGAGYITATATVTISNCVVYSNTASSVASGYGGGLYSGHSTVTLDGNTIISNTASTVGSGRGGGVYLAHSDATLNGNRMQGNLAGSSGQGDGGGLYSWSSTSTLSGNTVRGNIGCTDYGPGFGGGLCFWSSTATLIGNTVQGNTATLVDDTVQGRIATAISHGSGGRSPRRAGEAVSCGVIVIHGEGGGLLFIGSTATLSNNVVISNTASNAVGGSGGGLSFSNSSGVLIDNRIQGNTASTGSGMYSGGVGGGLEFYGNSNAILNGNLVSNNVASTASIGYGGGLYLARTEATLSGNRVQDNVASTVDCGMGGGLSLGISDATLVDNTIISNAATINPTAPGWGGGLRMWSDSTFTLTNSIFAGNLANTGGSGLWFEGESAEPISGRLRHTTIADNNGSSGQGVYVGDYTTLSFINTIIAGHTSVGVYVGSSGTADLNATLWYNGGEDTGGTGTIMTGTINVYEDPAFIRPNWGNYHIAENSAAKDTGLNAGVTTDIDGQPRPYDIGYDMGADEYWPLCVLGSCTYLPQVFRNLR